MIAHSDCEDLLVWGLSASSSQYNSPEEVPFAGQNPGHIPSTTLSYPVGTRSVVCTEALRLAVGATITGVTHTYWWDLEGPIFICLLQACNG